MARILIIDDDEFFVKLMVHTLSQRGHEIEFALNGYAASKLYKKTKYDVIVCDIIMPEQEGVETIQALRKLWPDMGIVAISGGLTMSDGCSVDVLTIAQQMGADATLKKPFQLPEFTATVERVLAKRHGPRLAIPA